jgi:acyl-coenzyme A synthetase/AMP-(fatty) acid ligase
MSTPALLHPDGSVALTHEALPGLRAELAAAFRLPAKGVVFLYAPNDVAGAAALIGLLGGQHALALLDPSSDAAQARAFIGHWSPQWVLQFDDVERTPEPAMPAGFGGVLTGLRAWRGTRPLRGAVHEDLSLLLATSGTVGSPKLVRLGADAVADNARAIGRALAIRASDVGIAHLPLHDSYGLSIVTSHLAAGAAVVALESAILSAPFWSAVQACSGTQFPGVPFHYDTLARLGLQRLVPPCVTCFTQAGGHLDVQLRTRIHADAAARGARFYVMYGQTEAAPRMTTLDPSDFAAHPASVGRALAGGEMFAQDEGGTPLAAGETGELVYRGRNVMMGHAAAPADLARGDEACGRLATGDVGHVDADGFVYVTGRNSRFAKVAGLRLALDEMERRLNSAHEVALVPDANGVMVFAAGEATPALDEELSEMAREYRIPRASFTVTPLAAIPRKASGKVDYAALRARA